MLMVKAVEDLYKLENGSFKTRRDDTYYTHAFPGGNQSRNSKNKQYDWKNSPTPSSAAECDEDISDNASNNEEYT